MPTAQEKLDKLTDAVAVELKRETKQQLFERIAALRIANKNLFRRLETLGKRLETAKKK